MGIFNMVVIVSCNSVESRDPMRVLYVYMLKSELATFDVTEL